MVYIFFPIRPLMLYFTKSYDRTLTHFAESRCYMGNIRFSSKVYITLSLFVDYFID